MKNNLEQIKKEFEQKFAELKKEFEDKLNQAVKGQKETIVTVTQYPTKHDSECYINNELALELYNNCDNDKNNWILLLYSDDDGTWFDEKGNIVKGGLKYIPNN